MQRQKPPDDIDGHTTVNKTLNTSQTIPYVYLALAAILALTLKLSVFSVGAPYVTIDDYTLFNAGFLVWFGEAPPQRMYFESWIVGLTSIATYIYHLITSSQIDKLGINLIADAYRSFHENPDNFVLTYRGLMLSIDMATGWLVFLLGKNIFANHGKASWLAAFAASLYLLSYNTIWCNIVARPDTCTAFFACLGMLYYYKSNFGEHKGYFYIAAIALGTATGFKLHGAVFVIFILVDLIRQHGLRIAINIGCGFSIVAFVVFTAVAGSPLFDPLLYVKLRALNAMDDASPWIKWGDQFMVLIRGTGWVIIPAAISMAALIQLKKIKTANSKLVSLALISILFVVFFASIRQLRAYWMLPTLPLLYILASYLLLQIKNKFLLAACVVVSLAGFIGQCIKQIHEFDNAEYHQLKTWVKNNIAPQDPIYIIGYDTLFLPQNTNCLKNQKQVILHQLEKAINNHESFTLRHIRLWEERSQLLLIDMLNETSNSGFNYYSLNIAPLEDLEPVIGAEQFKYLIVLDGYNTPEAQAALAHLGNDFSFVTRLNAPGGKGGTGGLVYNIYARKP